MNLLKILVVVDVSCEVDINPAVPRPRSVDAADELEIYPAVPSPLTVDVSCWLEI